MSVPSPGPDGTNGGLPVGGTTGQVLTKDSNADFDADWQNAGGGGLPAGGSIGQLIVNTGPGAGTWQNAPPATPLAHALSHESGGSDPITNLGALSGIGPISANVVIDGGGTLALNDGSIDRVVLQPSGAIQSFAANGAGAEVASSGLIFTDLSAQQLGSVTPTILILGDGTATTQRAVLTGDGTGLILNDAAANPKVSIGETAIDASFYNSVTPANPSARILSSDASLLLEHYDAAGTGTLLSSLTLADPGSNALVWKNADETERVTLKDDGTGLVLKDAAGVQVVTIYDAGLQITTPAGDYGTYSGSAISLASANGLFTADITQGNGGLIAADPTGTALAEISIVSGLRLVDAANAGVLITPSLAGFFSASPYGQDAFIDPTVITPEQLANYQIARGFMAAA